MRNYLWGSNTKLLTLAGVGLAALAISGCSDDGNDPKDECAQSKDCPGDQVCNDKNECVEPGQQDECKDNTDCPGDQICNDSKLCVEPGGSGDVCGDDGDCDEGEICSDDKKCIADPGTQPECTENNDCDEGEICNDDNECEAVAATCGDGELDEGEECDDGDANSDTEPDACRTNCTLPSCGDGVVDDGEACDDGPDGSDTCSTTCEVVENVDFRWTALTIHEPDVYIQALNPECDESQLDSLLNDTIGGMIADPEEENEDGEFAYELSINQRLPLPLAEDMAANGKLTIPECILGDMDDKICTEPDDMATSDWIFTRASADGTCFARVPEEANAEGWVDNPELTIDESLFPSNAGGNCILGESNDSFELKLNLLNVAEVVIELNGAHMAYELEEDSGEIRNGMLAGFLTHESADQDVLGLLNVQDIFNSGSDESCKDDVPLDKGPDADGQIVDGWWIYIAFEADDQVTVLD